MSSQHCKLCQSDDIINRFVIVTTWVKICLWFVIWQILSNKEVKNCVIDKYLTSHLYLYEHCFAAMGDNGRI